MFKSYMGIGKSGAGGFIRDVALLVLPTLFFFFIKEWVIKELTEVESQEAVTV